MIKQFYLMAAAAAVSAQVFAGANLIRNGTFEGSATQHKWGGYWDSKGFSCPGWKFEGLSGIAKSDGVWVAEKFSVGRYAMFLQPWKDATVSQVIPILPPGDYRLSFNYVARPNHPGNTQIWLGKMKLGEVESDATMRRFSTDFSLSEKQENVLFKFFSPARDAEKDIAIENVVLQRLDASIGDAKYPDLLTAMIHAADGDTIVYSPADGDAERIADALARRFISYDSVYWRRREKALPPTSDFSLRKSDSAGRTAGSRNGSATCRGSRSPTSARPRATALSAWCVAGCGMARSRSRRSRFPSATG